MNEIGIEPKDENIDCMTPIWSGGECTYQREGGKLYLEKIEFPPNWWQDNIQYNGVLEWCSEELPNIKPVEDDSYPQPSEIADE